MSDEKIVQQSLTENTLISDLQEIAEGQDYWLLSDSSIATQVDDYMQQISLGVSQTEDGISVFPVEQQGELVWNQLIPDLAILAAPPQQTAIIVVPVEKIQNATEETVWEFLAEQSSQLVVIDSLKIDTNSPLVRYPEFTPQNDSMPDWLRKHCSNISFEDVQSPPDAIAVKAGLFQIHGDLHTSHEYSQDCQGEGKFVAGDYWHGIMHRREPDYGNSKYWFRRVGVHPVFGVLDNRANMILTNCYSPEAENWRKKITGSGWNPNSFIDLCEECASDSDEELSLVAREIQWIEMILLLRQTHHDAVR